MAITSPRAIARNQEWRVVKITESNPATHHISAEDQYGTPVMLDTTNQSSLLQIPLVGEMWTVSRRGSDWLLEGRYESPDTQLPITQMNPGDVRIEAPGDITVLSGEPTDLSEGSYGIGTYGTAVYGARKTRITLAQNTLVKGDLKLDGTLTDEDGSTPTTITPPSNDSSSKIATTSWTAALIAALIAARGPQVTTSAMSGGPPTSPNNGDIWIATNVDTNGTCWQFQYNASSGSTYKWEFIGGSSLWVGDTTGGTTTSTTAVDVGTTLTLTLARSGDYMVTMGFRGYNSSSGNWTSLRLYDYTNAPTTALNTIQVQNNILTSPVGTMSSATFKTTGLTGGHEFRARYDVSNVANTATIDFGNLSMWPIRIS
jgi:hypothetical protein